MKSTGRKFFDFCLVLSFIFTTIAFLFKIPSMKNYFFEKDQMTVQYSWVSPDEMQVGPSFNSAIPEGYSIYVYQVHTETRDENSYSISPNEKWTRVGTATGWDQGVILKVNKTDVIEAVCVKSDTDPTTPLNHKRAFTTWSTKGFFFPIDCN